MTTDSNNAVIPRYCWPTQNSCQGSFILDALRCFEVCCGQNNATFRTPPQCNMTYVRTNLQSQLKTACIDLIWNMHSSTSAPCSSAINIHYQQLLLAVVSGGICELSSNHTKYQVGVAFPHQNSAFSLPIASFSVINKSQNGVFHCSNTKFVRYKILSYIVKRQ